jgi:hypothetical protein
MNHPGLTMEPPPAASTSAFQFERDTFTFANELVWQYRFDAATGAMTVAHNDPPPTYFHRCFVVVRSARQFFYHARFAPDLPAAEAGVYRRLIRQVVSRSPRRASPASERIPIPGFGSLRALSQAHEPLLKAECGGPWQSYFLRSHWRMVFPVWGRHQERMARQLRQAVRQGQAPTVHLFRFPRITINHGLLLFDFDETKQKFQFQAYDPNIPAHPVKLFYDRDLRVFDFPPACYWAGGPVKVVQIFSGGLY